MNFEEFKEQLMEDLKAYLPIEIGAGVEVEANEVHKVQHEGYEGIVVKREDNPVGVNMDAEKLYSDLQQGKSYDDVFHYAVDVVQKGFENAPEVDLNMLMDYDRMKDSLVVQMIPIAGNEEMLANMPHQEMEDLAVVYRFSVGRDDSGMASILIKNDLLERYGITAEQLHQDAMTAAPNREPANIRSMTDVLVEMMGPEVAEMMGGEPIGAPNLFVATNESKVNGAGVIAYPDFMEEAAEVTGGSFYIIPSSIHETLLVPDDGNVDFRDLEAMVHEVNATQVAPADRLSENVYHYDAQDKVFELASKFEDRMAEKAAEKDADRDERGSVLKDLDKKSKEVAAKGEKAPATPKKNRSEETL